MTIMQRLTELESKVNKNLWGVIAYEDGTTRRLPVIEIPMNVMAGLRGEQARAINIEWQGNVDGFGVIPGLIEYLIAEGDADIEKLKA